MGVRALLVADLQQITKRIVTLLACVAQHLLVGTEFLLQEAEHHFFIRDILAETITQCPGAG